MLICIIVVLILLILLCLLLKVGLFLLEFLFIGVIDFSDAVLKQTHGLEAISVVEFLLNVLELLLWEGVVEVLTLGLLEDEGLLMHLEDGLVVALRDDIGVLVLVGELTMHLHGVYLEVEEEGLALLLCLQFGQDELIRAHRGVELRGYDGFHGPLQFDDVAAYVLLGAEFEFLHSAHQIDTRFAVLIVVRVVHLEVLLLHQVLGEVVGVR